MDDDARYHPGMDDNEPIILTPDDVGQRIKELRCPGCDQPELVLHTRRRPGEDFARPVVVCHHEGCHFEEWGHMA